MLRQSPSFQGYNVAEDYFYVWWPRQNFKLDEKYVNPKIWKSPNAGKVSSASMFFSMAKDMRLVVCCEMEKKRRMQGLELASQR